MRPRSESAPPTAAAVSRDGSDPSRPDIGVQPPPAAIPVQPWFHGLRPVAGEAAAAGRLGLALLGAGIPLGVLWWAVAPRRAFEVAEDGAFAVVPESEAAVGSDGWLMLLTGGLALVAAAVAWRRESRRGPLIPVGLAVGMVLSGVLAWQVGALLGQGPSAAELADIGAVVVGPLELRAYGVLVVGAFLAVSGYLLAVCFAPRDDLRPADGPPVQSLPLPPPQASPLPLQPGPPTSPPSVG